MSDEKPAQSEEQPGTVTTTNQADSMTNSAQIGAVETVNFLREHETEELFGRQVNEAELNRVRKTFVAPGDFDRRRSSSPTPRS